MADESHSALTGAAFELANAGYVPMPDFKEKDEQEAISSDSASLRDAAEKISAPRDEVVVRAYIDSERNPAAPHEAVTLDRAGRDYAGMIATEKVASEQEGSKELAARVDALRAEALARDPEAAEFYGFESPETRPAKANSGQRGLDDAESKSPETDRGDSADRTAELDPELEKALLHPQVRQAIEEKVGEAERTRQSYLNGLAEATQIAQLSFVSQFPELASVAPENLPGALEQMSRQEPQKFARVQAMVATTEHLLAQQQQESRRQGGIARQNFQNYAKSEDARFETLLKGEPKETQAAVTAEIFASAKASGIERAELMRLFDSEPLMRNAIFQRMMYDAGKYRLAMKAKDAAAAKAVPPVQRPGTASSPAERAHADLRTLSARLSSSGDIKDAVALYHARKSSRS